MRASEKKKVTEKTTAGEAMAGFTAKEHFTRLLRYYKQPSLEVLSAADSTPPPPIVEEEKPKFTYC